MENDYDFCVSFNADALAASKSSLKSLYIYLSLSTGKSSLFGVNDSG